MMIKRPQVAFRTGICSHKQIGLEMSLEGGDGGEPSNVSWQVIPRLWSCDRIGSRSKGRHVNVRHIEFPFKDECR